MAAPDGYIRSLLHNPWVLAALSCLVVAGTTSLVAHYIWRTDIGEARVEFHQMIADTTSDVEDKVRGHEQLIRGLALIAGYRGLDAAKSDWAALTRRLLPEPGESLATSISLVAYTPAPALYPQQKGAASQGDGNGPEFSARIIGIDRDTSGKSLMGYDLNADSIRREALESARDSGTVAITSPLILRRDHYAGATTGFLLIAPVYTGEVPETIAARRALLRGYVVVAYRMRDLLNPVQPRLSGRVSLSISDPSDGYTPLIYYETDEPNRKALFQDQHGLLIADRLWQLTYQTAPDYEVRLHRQHAVRIVSAGLLLALLVALLVWRLARSWGLAEAMVHGVSDELRRYQSLLRTVIDVIPEPVLVKNRDFKLVLVNQAYVDRAGLSIDALIGKDGHASMPKVLADSGRAADQAVFDSQQDQVFELSLPNRMLNATRNYIVTQRFARDADGNPIIVAIHSDVTEMRRKIAEFAAIIEQTPLVAVQGFDRNGVLTHWNKASENLFGYSAAQALGSRLQDLIMEPRLQRLFEHAVEDAWIEQKAFGPREVHMRLSGDQRVVLLVTLFPVVVEGRVLELFSMAVDVSDRYEAERLLALHRDNLQMLVDERTAGLLRAKQDVEHALQARSEFLANMSHELRTPMHAVLSFAQLGEERAGKGQFDKLRDYFARIATSGERLLVLINNLLDLSKLEAGKMVLDRHEKNLVAVVYEVAAELELLVEKQGLSLVLPPRDAAINVEIDLARMHQVMSNLLSNAIRFSPSGGRIEVGLALTSMRIGRRATDSIERSALKLTVSDEGPGIPPDELDIVFEKFVQSSTTRTGAGGTGLGLAICREIVHAHQGIISVSNRPEGGALFEVLLPCQVHEAAQD